MPIYRLRNRSPSLPPSGRYWVAPDANLIGDVVLGEDASVWFGATLRGDIARIAIGERTNIQDGTIVHVDVGIPATIGNDVVVGHRVVLHGCTVGDGSLIGMGAVLLDGCRIGRNCLVGANALVTEGREFPDNSVILGMPAKAVRSIDPEYIAMIRSAVAHYVERWREFAGGLARVD